MDPALTNLNHNPHDIMTAQGPQIFNAPALPYSLSHHELVSDEIPSEGPSTLEPLTTTTTSPMLSFLRLPPSGITLSSGQLTSLRHHPHGAAVAITQQAISVSSITVVSPTNHHPSAAVAMSASDESTAEDDDSLRTHKLDRIAARQEPKRKRRGCVFWKRMREFSRKVWRRFRVRKVPRRLVTLEIVGVYGERVLVTGIVDSDGWDGDDEDD